MLRAYISPLIYVFVCVSVVPTSVMPWIMDIIALAFRPYIRISFILLNNVCATRKDGISETLFVSL